MEYYSAEKKEQTTDTGMSVENIVLHGKNTESSLYQIREKAK